MLRIILLILKHLLHFDKVNAITRSLESVLGPCITDSFRKRFCRIVGHDTGFGNPIYRCQTIPSGSVMPGLPLQANLNFSFNFVSLHGETYGDFLNRMDAESTARDS